MTDEVSEVLAEEVDLPGENTGDIGTGIVVGLVLAAICSFFTWIIATTPVPLFQPQKHTGQFTVLGGDTYEGFLMKRPNNEEFIMKFDSGVNFCVGVKVKDLVYTDESRDVRHFIKVTVE